MKLLLASAFVFVLSTQTPATLEKKLDDIITKAKANGEIAKLSEKWLKAPLPPGF